MTFTGSLNVGPHSVYTFTASLPEFIDLMIKDAEALLTAIDGQPSPKLDVSVNANIVNDHFEVFFNYPNALKPGEKASLQVGVFPIPGQVASAVTIAEQLGLPSEVSASISIA